jgi:hypothetical protein
MARLPGTKLQLPEMYRSVLAEGCQDSSDR